MNEGDQETPTPAPREFTAPDPAALNELLDGYEFTELIACGGMGAVYRARQLSLGRDVAIKVLPPELSQFEDFQRCFKVEAQAMARLTHTNLIGIYDFGEVAGMLYLVMEFVAGKSLFHAAKGQAVDPLQAVEIVRGVAAGLGHAHKHGIIHRDIKPANVLLTHEVDPKLGDFGLAVAADDVGAGMNMGTPEYVAPEVHRNFESASPASDVYSLGVILHELLSGAAPVGAQVPNLDLVPNLRGLRALAGKAVASNPHLRYPNGAAMAEALGDWIAQAKKFPPHLLSAGPQPARIPPPTIRQPAPIAAGPDGKRTGLLLSAAGLAAVLAIGAVVFINSDQTGDRPDRAGNAPPPPGTPPTTAAPRTGNVSATATNAASFDLDARRNEMRSALAEARARLLESRRANLDALKAQAGRSGAWNDYFALVDRERAELPRYLVAEDKVQLDESMAALLNRFALENQHELDRTHRAAIEDLHRKSIAVLREAGALPAEDLSKRWERWAEWLGENPLHLLAIQPCGDWELWRGPPEKRGATVTIGRGGTVSVSHKSFQSTGELKRSGDGQLTITCEDGSTWKLRWRNAWLEGEDQAGTPVQFRIKEDRFAATAIPQPLPGATQQPEAGEDEEPDEPPIEDKALAKMRAEFRAELQRELAHFVSSYLDYLNREREKAAASGDEDANGRIQAEIARVEGLQWQRGRISPKAIASVLAVPPDLRQSQQKFDSHLIGTIGQRQRDHADELKALKTRYLDDGIDTFEVDRELEPFLRHRRIDLTAVYNAQPNESWSGPSSSRLQLFADAYRSAKGIEYDLRGIVQLNSGTYRSGSEGDLIGKDINEFLGKSYPDAVTGIPVHQQANSMFLVGACIWGFASDGRTVARVVLNYEDGSASKLLLKSGRHMADWYAPKEMPNAFVIWKQGRNGVYEIELNNPRPDETIATIDLESGKESAAPFFLSITLD